MCGAVSPDVVDVMLRPVLPAGNQRLHQVTAIDIFPEKEAEAHKLGARRCVVECLVVTH